MNWKQFLTEKVLNGCWHERVQVGDILNMRSECSCGKPDYLGTANDHINRTFDNRSDLMDLYEKVYEDGKWDDFFWDFAFKRKPENYGLGEAETSVWLFCLDGKDYEAQCKMVAEFYGWEEKV